MSTSLTFSNPQTYQSLEESSPVELDQADFGIIKLTREGEVLHYNQYEADLSGVSTDSAIGKNFFTQIAPCTNNFMVAHKYAQAEEAIDETIPYIFTYHMAPTKVNLRLLADAGVNTAYLLVKKA